jgi:hypothetical protein
MYQNQMGYFEAKKKRSRKSHAWAPLTQPRGHVNLMYTYSIYCILGCEPTFCTPLVGVVISCLFNRTSNSSFRNLSWAGGHWTQKGVLQLFYTECMFLPRLQNYFYTLQKMSYWHNYFCFLHYWAQLYVPGTIMIFQCWNFFPLSDIE